MALNNDFQSDCSDVLRILIGLSIPRVSCFVFAWGIMGKCELYSFVLKIILLRHKVGLCLHGHVYISCLCVCLVGIICVLFVFPSFLRPSNHQCTIHSIAMYVCF